MSDKKSDTLGMPHGTAKGRLRKNILFHLLKKHNENFCFKCSAIIDDVKDLSIEHKRPWEGVSSELFWDIDNIAFSHLSCNISDRRASPRPSLRKVGLEGTAWCSQHKEFLPVVNFTKDVNRFSGLYHTCKECRSKIR